MSVSCQNGIEDLREIGLDKETNKNTGVTADNHNSTKLRHRKVKQHQDSGETYIHHEEQNSRPCVASSDSVNDRDSEVSSDNESAEVHVEEIGKFTYNF